MPLFLSIIYVATPHSLHGRVLFRQGSRTIRLMSTRQIALSTFWQLASQITMAALSILVVKFVALALTKELVGYHNSAYGYLQVFGILADFGLYAVAVKEVSRGERRDEILGAFIILRTGILALSLGAAILFAWLMPMWRGTPLPTAITIAAFVPFFTLLAGILRTVFQVTYTMHWVFVAEVSQRIFTVSAIGAFIVMGYRQSNDPRLLYAFLAIGGMGALMLLSISLLAARRFLRANLRPPAAILRMLLRKSAPFGLAFFCMALYRYFDTTLIAMLRNDFELQNAYYGIALRMAEVGYLIPTFLLNSTLPMITGTSDRTEKLLLGKTFMIVILLGIMALLFSAMWARPLVQLLTTASYLSTSVRPGADTALRFLAVPIFLNGIVVYCFYVLLSQHAWRGLVAALLLGAVLSLGLNVALIPRFGFQGATTTLTIVHVLLVFALLPQARRAMPMLLERKLALRGCLFVILLIAGLWTIKPLLVNDIATVLGLVSMSAYILVIGLICRFQDLLLPVADN